MPHRPAAVPHPTRRMPRIAAVVVSILAAPACMPALHAQAPREIGRTAANNPVLVEPRTVKRTGALLDAVLRVQFAKAVRTPGGEWWSSRTRLTFDCRTRQVKVLENWYYADTAWRRVASHTQNGAPAFGTVMGGSMTSVGYDTLCPVR